MRSITGNAHKAGPSPSQGSGPVKGPSNVLLDLQQTAFGCDWLIRQWEQLDASLRVGGSWDRPALDRAEHLLGLPEGVPGVDAEEEVRLLWILASPGPRPRLPPGRPPGSATKPACRPPPIPRRTALRDLVAGQIDHLLDLREDSWDAFEGPEARALALQHSAADTSKDGQLRHRYANAADRSCNAAVRLYLNNRDSATADTSSTSRRRPAVNRTPRCAPVGDGWWREADSDPSPPGFSRVDPAPATDTHFPPIVESPSTYKRRPPSPPQTQPKSPRPKPPRTFRCAPETEPNPFRPSFPAEQSRTQTLNRSKGYSTSLRTAPASTILAPTPSKPRALSAPQPWLIPASPAFPTQRPSGGQLRMLE